MLSKIREELIYGLAGAMKNASKTEIQRFVEKEVLTLFLDMLESSNSRLIVQILKGLEELLYYLREHKYSALQNKTLLERLDELQYHPDQTVLQLTQKIIDKFFETD